MSYKVSAKNRRLKRTLQALLWFFRFGWGVSTPFHKVVIFGCILTLIGLSLSWMRDADRASIGNGYNAIFWISGYVTAMFCLMNLFVSFNEKQKEYIKGILALQVKDGYLLFFFSLFCFILTVNGIFIVEWMSYFKEGLLFGKWLVIAIVGSILSIVGSIGVIRHKTQTGVFIDEEGMIQSPVMHTPIHSDNNMKLPF